MKIITHNDILDLNISLNHCYNWVEESFNLKKEAILKPKTSCKPTDDIFYTSMPCAIPKYDIYGNKVVSRVPNANPSLSSEIILYQMSSGKRLALMDCDWITAMRTGAVAALSIIKLAKKDYSTIGMIGLGNTSRSALLILLTQIKDRNLKIKLKRYKNQAEDFIQRFAEFKNLDFEIVDTNEELIRGSDVIISAITSAKTHFGEDEWFEPGVLVVPIHTMGFQNCDLFFEKVIGDDYGHIETFKYFKQFKEFHELSEILTSPEKGRENKQQRIIAYNVGIALHDVVFAYKIYEMMKDIPRDVIDLKKPISKFWI